MSPSTLADLLARHWGMRDAVLTPLDGGMNSRTWLVEDRHGRYVAKLVAERDAAALAAGCEAADAIAEAGLITGRALPTKTGRWTPPEVPMALLEHVEGRPLTGDTAVEQRLMATTLARAHAAGAPQQESGTFFTDWLDPEAPGVAALPWLPPAIARVRRETDRLATTWTLLHTDPAPEAFLHDDGADGGPGDGEPGDGGPGDDGRGVTALIDWSGACRGPVLYDVASAIMYLGGLPGAEPFLTAYRDASDLEATEFEHLDVFRRFRWVVQATYFAGRLATGDLTGIDDRAGNEKGLADARRGLTSLGVRMQ